jgi:site-specific recombinase XerD
MNLMQSSRGEESSIILVLLDTGIRLTQLAIIKLIDIDNEISYVRIVGKGSKRRVDKIGKVAQKAH